MYAANPYQQNMFYPQVQQPVYRPMVPQNNFPAIPGKIVNTLEDVRPNEVPGDGSIAVFPCQDLSCIYVKYISGDGRINTVKFVVETPDVSPVDVAPNQNGNFEDIKKRLDKIEKNLSKLVYAKKPYVRKEGDTDAPSDE